MKYGFLAIILSVSLTLLAYAGDGRIMNADISDTAGIAYSKLSLGNSILASDINAAAAIPYSKLSLSNSILNADINTAAAIAYSKLALTGSIVNADVSGSAAIAYSKLNLSNSLVAGDYTASSIANAKLANMADQTVKGNVSGGAAAPSDLSKTELTTLINAFTSGLSGAVPASGGGTTNFLRADGTFAAPVGTASPLTTKGDLYAYDTGNARLPVGANGFVLTADSTQALGIKWAASTSGAPTTYAIAALDIDWATALNTGGVYTKTLGANSTFTFSNLLAGQTIIVRVTNPSTYTVAWPTVIWPGGIPPTQSTGGKTDIYTFIYDGVATYGSYVQEGGAFSGTVSSVALSLPSIFNVTGSPVTTTGTLGATLASQTQNTFFAAPNGSSGAPTFRAIVAADVPTLNQSTTGNAATATALAANPSDCAADTYATTIAANGNLTCSTVSDAGLAVSYIKADGTRALTGNWNAGAFNITASTFIGALTGNASTASALAANPSDCAADTYATTIAANGNLTCSTVSDAGLAVSYIKADGTRALTGNWNAGAFNITATTFIGALTGNSSTATALAANPSDCSAGQYANAIAANGNLTCSAIASTELPAPATSTISASNIDWSTLKNVDGLYTKTLGANTTFTFSNVTAGQTIVIAITNTASNYTLTWPAAAKWSGGTAPTQTVGAKTDIYTCKAYDSTNAYCTASQNY